MSWDESQHMDQPRLIQWGNMLSVYAIIDVIEIALQESSKTYTSHRQKWYMYIDIFYVPRHLSLGQKVILRILPRGVPSPPPPPPHHPAWAA
jgi:hypothetical protein